MKTIYSIISNRLLLSSIFFVIGLCCFHLYGQEYFKIASFDAKKSGHKIKVTNETFFQLTLENLKKTSSIDSVDITLSLFTGSNSLSKKVQMRTEKDAPIVDHIRTKIDRTYTFYLVFGKLIIGDTYQGEVLIRSKNKIIDTLSVSIERVSSPRKSEIELPLGDETILMYSKCDSFIFSIKEKSGERSLDNLSIELVGRSSFGGNSFNAENFRFKIAIDDEEPTDWYTASNKYYVDLDEGQIATVVGYIENLEEVGSHQLKFKVSASNALKDKEPIYTVNVTRKHRIYIATVVIIAAILFAFVTNKYLKVRQSRIGIKRRSNEINNRFSLKIPYNTATIRAKRTLRMSEYLSSRSFSGFEALEEQLKIAEEITRLLQLSGQVFHDIARLPDGMKKRRIKKCYDNFLDDLANLELNDSNKLALEKKAIELTSWFTPPQNFDNLYKADLEKDIGHFSGVFNPAPFSALVTNVNNLFLLMKNQTQPSEDREDAYAVLKVFSEANKRNTLPANVLNLLDNAYQNGGIDELFETYDDLNWAAIDGAFTRNELSVIVRSIGGRFVETFKPFQLKVDASNMDVTNNYLFKHGLRFAWKITITDTKGDVSFIKQETDVPRIRQFSPVKGQISAEVTIYYKNNKIKLNPTSTIPVKRSAETKWILSANWNEYISISAAAFLALLTGINTYYLGDAFYGTLSDYILLFLWGAGVEQGTNFLAYLKSQ